MKQDNIIWKPQPKQAEFMMRSEYEVFYGGAAGGGKSDAIVVEALRQISNPFYKALILRKTMPQAKELIQKSLKIYPKVEPKARYNHNEHIWTFPSGALIIFSSMASKTAYFNYQGKSYAYIAFDELTQFTKDEYEWMISRNRPDGPNLKVYIRSTGNPGGIGHAWVKERFITSSPPGVPQVFKIKIETPDGKIKTVKRDRVFIPSSVWDNKILLNNDPNYIANLASLPEARKRALLYGDWDSFSGQVFSEFKDDPKNYRTRKFTHVIEPFEIPKHWRRYRSFDYGYSKPFAVQWWAADMEGRLYLYRQMYGCTDTPDTGLKWEPTKLAQEIKRIEDEHESGNFIHGIADPAIWDSSRGKDGTIITMFENNGIYFDKAKNDRWSGLMQCHYRMKFDSDGYPNMYVFNTCKDFLRTIPNIIYDETRKEDVNTRQEDHDYDAMRYMFMCNPISENKIIELSQEQSSLNYTVNGERKIINGQVQKEKF